MSELAQHGTAYDVVEGEPPELMGRNLVSAAHLLASATAFFFLAFLFAYFYLRSLNNAHLWKPKGVDPSLTFGTLVMALTVVSAMLVRLRSRQARRCRRREGVDERRIGDSAVRGRQQQPDRDHRCRGRRAPPRDRRHAF